MAAKKRKLTINETERLLGSGKSVAVDVQALGPMIVGVSKARGKTGGARKDSHVITPTAADKAVPPARYYRVTWKPTRLERAMFKQYTAVKRAFPRSREFHVWLSVNNQHFCVTSVPMDLEHADFIRCMLASALARIVENSKQ